ncbi:hypothetical protein HPB48_005525 [Haemaphysalis longicornis]|uniref:Uncharacterized protein n=1 Tax=Haemaphysalis longicornis TaxID=44386 RepID=A0A9J6H4D3_HAELO|nr:hypothetical protein HPB48_005525 [Haemaphysalis longicornis]
MTESASSAPAELNERLRELEESVAEKDRLIQADCLKIQELQNRVVVLQQERAALLCDINDIRAQLGYPVLEALENER